MKRTEALRLIQIDLDDMSAQGIKIDAEFILSMIERAVEKCRAKVDWEPESD